jgi:DNA-binding LacI/PurR family transcriptional regulator
MLPVTFKVIMMSQSRVTIRDVAKHAGVSHQTVSRVINNSMKVAPKTREKVQASIVALGYKPNAIARSMALGRTRLLGCLAPNLTDFTFASLVEGAEVEAREHGYFLITSSAPSAEVFKDLTVELIDSRQVSGMIVINPYIDQRYHYLPPNIPLVFIGSHPRKPGISSVTLNDELAGYQAAKHLIDLGHRDLAMVTGWMKEDCAQKRWLGFEKALKEAGLNGDSPLVVEGDWSATSGREAFLKMVSEGRVPSGVFAQNDRMAIGVIQAARDLGIHVPDQLSVIGLDDLPLASYFDPPLTTIRQDINKIGSKAAQLLIEKIEDPSHPVQNITINPDLLIRNSTARFEMNQEVLI